MADQRSPLTEAQRGRAEEMARRGRMISTIARELRVDYGDVWTFLSSVDAYSWLGAKRIVTNRLNAMVKSSRSSTRQELADQAYDMVEYLYYAAKTLGDQVHKIKEVLD